MKKQFPAWASCLLLILLTVFVSRHMWIPITESTGERSMQVLEKVFFSDKYITLDFGHVHDYRVARSNAAQGLLDEAAIGQSYDVTARYHSSGKSRNRYYEVLALSGADGTVYRTIEESEANRQAALPGRICLLITLDIACCALFIWRERRINQQKKEAAP